jgi:hypothetical protein
MASLTSNTTYVGEDARGIWELISKFTFSNDFVNYEELDLSAYVGEIIDVDAAPYASNAYAVLVDTTNSDLDNASVALALHHWDNGALVAANTNATAVSFRLDVKALRKND